MPNSQEFEDLAAKFEVGSYLIEMKATTTGKARLTPTQARVASQEQHRYILCVVDLRGLSEEELGSEWTASRVENLARIVPDIGIAAQETYSLVDAAKDNSVVLRNEMALRYEVPYELWQHGVSIENWVKLVLRGR